MINLSILSFNYEHPSPQEPEWKESVSRWYQLDAYAYGLGEGAFRLAEKPSPNLIILASPGVSSDTDKSFAEEGAVSPVKFAHTLPNIRCSPYCQVAKWAGPVVCMSRAPQTMVRGLIEASNWLNNDCPRVRVLGVIKKTNDFKVFAFDLSKKVNESGAEDSLYKIVKTSEPLGLTSDSQLLQWLDRLDDSEAGAFSLGSIDIRRN